MIQPIRVIHRRAFVTLALVLPAILLIGLGARHPGLGPDARAADVRATQLTESSELWQKHGVSSRFYIKSDRPQDIYVMLQPSTDLNEPDLLLYWAADAPHGDSLPGEARLVGAFAAGKALVLPWTEKRSGYLILFSLAHQTVFDRAKVEKLP